MSERKVIVKTVKVELHYEINKKGIVCYNHKTFRHFWGSNAVPTYLKGIERIKGEKRWYTKAWLIPKDLLIQRRDMFKAKMEKCQSNIDLIEETLAEIK